MTYSDYEYEVMRKKYLGCLITQKQWFAYCEEWFLYQDKKEKNTNIFKKMLDKIF